MIKAVLLDLDDTLLHADTQQFTARYLGTLAAKLPTLWPTASTEQVKDTLKRAIFSVQNNLDPLMTNGDVFLQTLSSAIDGPGVQDTLAFLNNFYAKDYQQFTQEMRPVAEARLLVDRLVSSGLALVIATNPVFPLATIVRRLQDANLDPKTFALITSADEMHFVKPQPHYYEEILTRIGVEADEAIMVGDSLDNDMRPAAEAGLNTFWIHGHDDAGNNAVPDSAVKLDAHGTLADFAQRVDLGWLSSLQPHPRTAEQVIPRLIADVAALHGMVNLTKPSYWYMRPIPDEWTPLEILCHLRDSEQAIQRSRLEKILTEDNPFISQAVPPFGPGERDLVGENGPDVLQSFWLERQNTIGFLKTLSADDWQRPARHSIFGPTTLLEMAHFTTRHDHLHINQFCQTIGRCQEQ